MDRSDIISASNGRTLFMNSEGGVMELMKNREIAKGECNHEADVAEKQYIKHSYRN